MTISLNHRVNTANTLTHTKYRADIDGLRAVAVLSVVGFHAFPEWIGGGFVGVDIFFVISGFLISGILFASLDNHVFSMATFYARRIRRIFPALIVVLAFCVFWGWFTLLPDEYRQLGRHIVGGAGFVSNFLLWTEAGYFDQVAETKPLLHLWSLGIEEQFYLVWPLVVWGIWKSRRSPVIVCMLLAAASFISNVLMVKDHAAAAFYSPLPRFWELMVGCLLACVDRQPTPALKGISSRRRGVVALAGLLLIGLALLLIDKNGVFPGYWALLPCMGCALLIFSGETTWINRNILSQPLLVWIGLISFPLYLWHWPLLTFFHIVLGQTPPVSVRIATVLLSVLLAWLTYRFIEYPIRSGSYRRQKIVTLAVGMVLLTVVGYGLFYYDGLENRAVATANPDSRTMQVGAGRELVNNSCGVPSSDKSIFTLCFEDMREVAHFAVWGDSKASALYWGLVRQSTPGKRWLLLGRPGCVPIFGFQRISHVYSEASPDLCVQSNRVGLTMLENNKDIHTVLYVVAARMLLNREYAKNADSKPDSMAVWEGMDNVIKLLINSGKKVVLVIDNPTLDDPKRCMSNRVTSLAWFDRLFIQDRKISAKCSISVEQHLEATKRYRALIARLVSNNPSVSVFDPTNILCDMDKDRCPISINGNYLYSYGDHISDYANTLIANKLLKVLQ